MLPPTLRERMMTRCAGKFTPDGKGKEGKQNREKGTISRNEQLIPTGRRTRKQEHDAFIPPLFPDLLLLSLSLDFSNFGTHKQAEQTSSKGCCCHENSEGS